MDDVAPKRTTRAKAQATADGNPSSATPPARVRRKHIPRVALLIETTRSYGRNVMRGVGDYERVHGPWLFFVPTEMPLIGVPSKDEWDGDGIIAQPRQDQEFLRQLNASGVPVVSLSGPPGTGGLPAVRANQDAVAELAINHFRERGFTRFAYCGAPREKVWPPTGAIFPQARRNLRVFLRRLRRPPTRPACVRCGSATWQNGSNICPSRSRCWHAMTCAPARCWTPAALPACTCRRRSRCWA
jgi:DNA-binding LacI/PurR family transcriptional regulator